MKNLRINNSKIKNIKNYSKIPVKISSTDSDIDKINIYDTTSIITGHYSSEFNFINSCNIYLVDNFILENTQLNLLNCNNKKNLFNLFGVLNSLNADLIINLDSNIIPSIFINAPNSNKNINLNCISSNLYSKEFFINHFNPKFTENFSNKIPLNILAPRQGNLTIDSNLNSIDFTHSEMITLFIEPDSKINYFNNIKNSSFKSISADMNNLEKLCMSTCCSIPIEALLCKTNIKDGIGIINLPKCFNIPKIKGASIILSNTEYIISNHK